MRAVLDTNVWISGLLFPNGTCGELLKAVRRRAFVVVASWALAEELTDVLSRPRIRRRYGIDDADLSELLELMKPLLPTVEMETPVRDPDDAPVMAAAVTGRADVVVSGDLDLHEERAREWLSERRIAVLTPRELLDRLAESPIPDPVTRARP